MSGVGLTAHPVSVDWHHQPRRSEGAETTIEINKLEGWHRIYRMGINPDTVPQIPRAMPLKKLQLLFIHPGASPDSEETLLK